MLRPQQCTRSAFAASPKGLARALLPAPSIARRSRITAVRVVNESPIVEDYGHGKTRFNAPVFNGTRWSYHQDTGRYQRHLQSIFRSVTFRNLQAPLSMLSLISCLVVIYRTAVEMDMVTDYFEGVHFTDTPFQLTSFALSLLLVFRTDASYSRWCAAMDAWSELRTCSAALMRKAASWIKDASILRRLVRWVAAYALCLMVQLRTDAGTDEEAASLRERLAPVLRPAELEEVVAAGPYYHTFCLSVLTALVEAAEVGEGREGAMLEDLAAFAKAAGECEKILRFPIPLTYTRHTSRFMLLYLGALPVALYDSCDWATIPVTATISFLLLGIEDIGVQIEEPFSILPLPEICADLHTSAELVVTQRKLVRCLAAPDSCDADWEKALSSVSLSSAEDVEPAGAAVVAGARAGGGSGGGSGSPRSPCAAHRDAMSSKAAAGVAALRGGYSGSGVNGNGKGAGPVAAIHDASTPSPASSPVPATGPSAGVNSSRWPR
ncbi:hypothetical protein HYH02_006443 [Chlamydomonas schloesseri]|uniref:Uncharacterized protein n=1 Tax=Chlamydomonas schloesseri TaxID=2026947 RepID=A0A836B5Y2_9CHLO|nr:hypothetical protein HYH02_006443 [Chlamydomonas schloesseri]|eukprot:KAG2448552.1 hypothetical protein HYH02_006443 [Chlamydomonas schloesseri]